MSTRSTRPRAARDAAPAQPNLATERDPVDVGPAAGDEEEEEKGEPAPLPQANPLPLRTLLAPHPDQAATGEDGTDDNAGMSMVEMKEIMGEMRRELTELRQWRHEVLRAERKDGETGGTRAGQAEPPLVIAGVPEPTPLRLHARLRPSFGDVAPPPSTVSRTLTFPVPANPLVTGEIRSAASPITVATVAPSLRLKGVKVPQPEKFAGTTKDKAESHNWLSSVADWLRMVVGDQPEEVKVMMFGSVLTGQARGWFEAEKVKATATRQPLTLKYLFDSFQVMYSEGRSHISLQQEFAALTYKQGKCRDLASTDSQFDHLAFTLYPGTLPDSSADQLLGQLYGEVIRRGDYELWCEATRSRPKSLAEWKEAVQTSYEVLRGQRAGRGGSNRSAGSQWQNRGGATGSGPNVRLQHVNTDHGDDEKGQPDGDVELKADAGESSTVAAMQTANRGGRGPNKPSGKGQNGVSNGFELTPEQREALMKAGRCFACYQKGHSSRGCLLPREKRPNRAPTAEELKA